MQTLAVITHTNNERQQWFGESRDSVVRSMDSVSHLVDPMHHVIYCPTVEDLQGYRWQATELADFIVFVDDDDYIIGDALYQCVNALLENPDKAVAFTNERYIDLEGQTMPNPHPENRRVSYVDMAMAAQSCHHLCLIRTSMIDLTAKQLSETLGWGGEWMLKCSAGIRRGALHVPIEGYAWRRHPGSHSLDIDWQNRYGQDYHVMRSYLRSNVYDFGLVPQYLRK